MGKQSDAKRKAKLKERRKKWEAAIARSPPSGQAAAEWMAAHDAEPNIVAELVDENGDRLAYVEVDTEDCWTVFVDDEPVVGSSDEVVALGAFLSAAAGEQAAGHTCFLQFSPWFIEESERRCEERNLEWEEFLRMLLPPERNQMALPPHRMM